MEPSGRCRPEKPPFPLELQLCTNTDNTGPLTHVPGNPCLSLQDQHGVQRFLKKEVYSKDLESIADKLWWMTKQDSANISPLHRQRVKGRSIVVSEDPELHLVWIRDRIFIKPLPRYLLTHSFWEDHLGADGPTRKAALGYLRTYRYLIMSEHDFYAAQDPSVRLVPNGISWEDFCRFASSLAWIGDRDVSGRWAYGEIRLTRLNLYAPLLLGKMYLQRVDRQYGDYFASFYGPILFLIGITSIVLNGFQIVISAEQASPTKNSETLFRVASWFGVAMILCFSLLTCLLVLVFLVKVAKEWNYAIRDRIRLKKAELELEK